MDAYYAVDRCSSPAVVEQLRQQIRAKTGSSQTFALLDLAFDHAGKTLAWPTPLVPLYTEGPLARLEAVSPVLASIEINDDQMLARQVNKLLRHTSGRPMLSFVQTELDADSLCTYWQSFLQAETEDGQQYLLRWGDTRVLPLLAQGLPLDTWVEVTRPLQTWIFLNRQGLLEHLRLPKGHQPPPAQVRRISIGAFELDKLLHGCEPDSVIQALYESLPHLLPSEGRAGFYERVAACCQLAQRHNIAAFPDIVAIAAAECASSGMLSDPRLTNILTAHNWAPGHLVDLLVDLMPEQEHT